jgi:predicted RNA-binding protein with PUA-like domain
MNYWLVKTEPETYGWDDLVREGEGRWDGVRNYQARNFMKEMMPGDIALVYHSGKTREIVGEAKVVTTPYPDPTAEEPDTWFAVNLKALKRWENPVDLAFIKAHPELSGMKLVTNSRLSVMPVSEAHFILLQQQSQKK